MADFYMLEAVNLFMGDHDPTASNHLELEELKLPTLEEHEFEHKAGGSVLSVQFTINQLKAPEVTFKLKGFNPERLKVFGAGARHRNIFTAYGVVRSKRTGKELEARAVIEARLAKIDPTAVKLGEEFGHDFALKEIVAMGLWLEDKRLYEVDFFTNKYVIGDVDQVADKNRILRIPNAG